MSRGTRHTRKHKFATHIGITGTFSSRASQHHSEDNHAPRRQENYVGHSPGSRTQTKEPKSTLLEHERESVCPRCFSGGAASHTHGDNCCWVPIHATTAPGQTARTFRSSLSISPLATLSPSREKRQERIARSASLGPHTPAARTGGHTNGMDAVYPIRFPHAHNAPRNPPAERNGSLNFFTRPKSKESTSASDD